MEGDYGSLVSIDGRKRRREPRRLEGSVSGLQEEEAGDGPGLDCCRHKQLVGIASALDRHGEEVGVHHLDGGQRGGVALYRSFAPDLELVRLHGLGEGSGRSSQEASADEARGVVRLHTSERGVGSDPVAVESCTGRLVGDYHGDEAPTRHRCGVEENVDVDGVEVVDRHCILTA